MTSGIGRAANRFWKVCAGRRGPNPCTTRPTWLGHAHRAPDTAVVNAYGWPADLAEGEILERLLALNLERAGDSATEAVRLQ